MNTLLRGGALVAALALAAPASAQTVNTMLGVGNAYVWRGVTLADQTFLQGELTVLETVASLIAQVMENARLYREVENERSTLGAVLRGAADPILLIDPHDLVLLANPAAVSRLGLRSAGSPLTHLVKQPDLLRALWAVREVAVQG